MYLLDLKVRESFEVNFNNATFFAFFTSWSISFKHVVGPITARKIGFMAIFYQFFIIQASQMTRFKWTYDFYLKFIWVYFGMFVKQIV